MVAVLRVKIFHIQVFSAGFLLRERPDVVESIRSLTELTAIKQVMQRSGMQSAGAIYVLDENSQEHWLYDVYLTSEDELRYEYCVPALPEEIEDSLCELDCSGGGESMGPDEYALLVGGELEAIVSGEDARLACLGALGEYPASMVILARPTGESGYEEISLDEYARLGLWELGSMASHQKDWRCL